MSVHIFQPRSPLDQFIQCFWYVDLQVPYTREKILPSNTIELMINFGSPHRLYNSEESSFELMKTSWIAGYQTGYIVNEPVAETCMMGVRFKLGGAYPFLGLPTSEVTDAVIDMDCLWGNLIDLLRERLLEQPTLNGKVAVLEQVLLNRMQLGHLNWPVVQYAIDRIVAANGTLSLRHLSDEIGVSQKHLNTQIKKSVGVTPKRLSRVVRFQMVLNQIDPNAHIDWRAVAYACQYYDQSHFNHEFAAFTGMSPSEYVQFRRTNLPDMTGQGEAIHFVPIIG